MDLNLTGKVAIVTGAGRGLGFASALALAEEGAYVLGVARSDAELDALYKAGSDRIQVERCDVTDLDHVSRLPEAAVSAFGRLDIIVNNAGIAPAGSFLSQDADLWERVFAVNVFAPVALARSAGAIFQEQKSGKVINIASTSGILGKAGLVAYSASKGAVLQMTKALAAEWAPFNIQVNAIAPGAFETRAQEAVLESEDLLKRRLRKIPLGRMGDANEIGPLVCLLASHWSDFITGSVIVADGGESAKL